MSGFGGVLRVEGSVESHELQSMLDVMRHRAVDGGHYWCGQNIGFCHAMTFTTPESHLERLPAHSTDHAITITADARIDNRSELLAQLSGETRDTDSISDSTLILKAYQRWGDNCLDHLLGDFAFAIWDSNRRTLLVAMDPMGTRRLHYFFSGKLFAFATDIKAILTVFGVKKELNEEGFLFHASALTRLAPESTCFVGVNKLTGGKYLSISMTGSSSPLLRLSNRDYRQITAAQFSFQRPEECVEAFREIFQKAVICRMRSTFPVATLLSGGLDSSAVSCVAARHARSSSQSLVAISSCLAAGELGEDEKRFIDIVARQENIPVTYIAPTSGPADFLDVVHDMTESPINANPHVYLALYAAAKEEGARMLLDGFGGEWGATNHGEGYLAWLLRQQNWLRFFVAISEQAQVYSRSRFSILRREVLQPLMSPALLRLFAVLQGRQLSRAEPALIKTMMHKYRIPNSNHLLTKRALYFGDMSETRSAIINGGRFPKENYAAHFGVQPVLPFFDTRVLEFTLGLSPHWFVTKGWKRHFIRAALENVLPRTIQWRIDKKPFSPNYYRLMQSSSKTYQAIINELSVSDLAREYVDVERIGRTIKYLDQRGSWAPADGIDYARNVVDSGIQSIVFFRWFQQL